MKGLSVYGEPNFSILHKLDKFININKDTSILIVNAKDGIYTLPFAKKSKYITCYEENKDLLYDGIIDNFYSVGLVNRLKCNKLDSNVIIHNSNYYEDNEILLNGGIFNHTYTIGLNKRIVDSKLNNITVKNLNYYEVKEIKKYDFVYVSLSLNEEKHNILTNELINKGYIEKGDFQIYYYNKLFQELLEEKNSYKDLFTIIHYIVPRVVSRNFKDEDGYLIENKFGYFKNDIYSNINKLNFDIDSLWDNDLNDLYSEDDFER